MEEVITLPTAPTRSISGLSSLIVPMVVTPPVPPAKLLWSMASSSAGAMLSTPLHAGVAWTQQRMTCGRYALYRKEAVIWYELCLLRYSDRWSFPEISTTADAFMGNVANISAGELPLFNRQLGRMMAGLCSYAAYNSSGRVFAAGEADFTAAMPKIYGLVQCIEDLAADSCQRCLARGEHERWEVIVILGTRFTASPTARRRSEFPCPTPSLHQLFLHRQWVSLRRHRATQRP